MAALLLSFFLMVPLLQSLLFSGKSGGVIEIDKEIRADFIKSDKQILLIYFGYVGCADVCTPALQKISTLYNSDELKELKKDVDVLFINLTPDTESFGPALFAKFFHEDFKGVYLSNKEILSLDRTFGVFFSKDLNDKTELNHTDYLYLIENRFHSIILKKIYFTHPLSAQKLIRDIMDLKYSDNLK
ncbi:SCO family protein [bacterium]|nr:SCO family protein [bacterium]MBU1991118.1 SCO family protein [bacterium]